MISLNLGQTIKGWMTKKGISQMQLSQLSGISTRSLSRILNSPCYGRTENYVLICEALNITAEELIHGPEDEEQRIECTRKPARDK